jgi:hypothetical protein
MAHSYLIFDFGNDEETAQQARHKVESWKQGFRLGNKIIIKFEREEPEEEDAGAPEESAEASAVGQESSKSSAKHPADRHSTSAKHNAGEEQRGGKKKSSAKRGKDAEADKDEEGTNVRVIVRLDFSDHEKLSLQRWLDRIPTEEPFKSVEATIIRQGDPEFGKTHDLFETLG